MSTSGVIPSSVALRIALLRAIDAIDDEKQRLLTASLMDTLLFQFSKIDLAAMIQVYVNVQLGQKASEAARKGGDFRP